MRFTLGLVVGVVIGRPIANAVNEYLTPTIRRRIVDTLITITDRLNEKIERPEKES